MEAICLSENKEVVRMAGVVYETAEEEKEQNVEVKRDEERRVCLQACTHDVRQRPPECP